MRIAIMQPYFLPYIGYLQLANHVDKIVIYDDVQFTKKGWINRNILNSSEGPWHISIPVKNASAITVISQKEIASEFNRNSLRARIHQAYKTEPYLSENKDMLDEILYFPSDNLFNYLINSLEIIFETLEMPREKIVISSSLGDMSELKSEAKVLEICDRLGATEYLNPSSGIKLYSNVTFSNSGVELMEFNADLTLTTTEHIFSILHNLLTVGRESTLGYAQLGNVKNARD